jgi:hypothetical protein
MRAIAKAASAAGTAPPEHLRAWTMAGDLASNALYYSAVGLAPNAPLLAGAVAGVVAAAGLLCLPGPLGLGTDAVNRSRETEIMGASMYIIAGLVAGCTYQWLSRRD